MGNLNKVLIIGRLGQDPEKRITPNGHTVVNVSLATSEYFKDQGGNKQERTEWHRVVFWNRQAEIVEQYCRKGSQIYVEGSLQTREWQDKDGNKRYSTDIVARNLQLLDSRQQTGQDGSSQSGRPENPSPPYQPNNNFNSPQPDSGYGDQPTSGNNDEFVEDDIPF
ncbi:MAG: single-stranded DNA-binding protein [bacterium]